MRQRLKGEKVQNGIFCEFFFLKVRRGVKIGVTIISKKKIKHDHQCISLHDSLKIYQ